MVKKIVKLLRLPSYKNQSKRFTRSKIGNVMYFSILFFAGLFSTLPLIYCVTTSFKPLDELLIFPPRLFLVQKPTIANYTALPDLISGLSIPISRYLFNSVFISVVGTVAHVIVSAMAAFVLAKSKIKYKNIIFMIIQLSLLFNVYTLSIPRYVIYSEMKMINTYWVYILPFIPSAMGVFLMKQYMEGYVPDALIEAAKIDGADWYQTFFRIIFPMVRPCVLTLTLFSFRDIWGTIPAGTIFSEQLKTMPTIMSTIASGGLARTGSSMAASVIMMIPPIVVYFISQGSIRETMGSAGIKG